MMVLSDKLGPRPFRVSFNFLFKISLLVCFFSSSPQVFIVLNHVSYSEILDETVASMALMRCTASETFHVPFKMP